MIYLLVLSCAIHKTTLKGVVDYIGEAQCTIVLENSDMVIISSRVCEGSKEGDSILFYAKKE
tara:strand:- start:56 stop:241 length:186 start_codon:yes stop_codon:yes gene_type:complete